MQITKEIEEKAMDLIEQGKDWESYLKQLGFSDEEIELLYERWVMEGRSCYPYNYDMS